MRSFCIVQLFQSVDCSDTQVCNEYDCPLFLRTNVFQRLPSHCISHSISIVHECTASYSFKRADTATRIEREDILSRKVVFEHDFCNNLYCYNIYCMHSVDFIHVC